MRRVLLLPLLILSACEAGTPDGKGGAADTGGGAPADADGDGYDADEDCDDGDATRHPGAEEICNGIDDDCDAETDEGVTDTFYADADDDGFGDPEATTDACDAPEGFVPNGSDCDDAEPAAFPGNIEVCDEVDNDCDGEVDEDGGPTWYVDADGDGFGRDAVSVVACEAPSGFVATGGDCDDAEPAAFPGNIEVCDEVDNDCDGAVDEDVQSTFYADGDGDGYGDAGTPVLACSQPTGAVGDASDCDDARAAVNPAASEVCNRVDDDCDGLIDDADSSLDAATGGTWYADADGDGYGDASVATASCVQPSGTVTDATDCDDTVGAISPAGTEVCNGVDDDCDGDIDDADSSVDLSTGGTWYTDGDADGYGAAAVEACSQPSGAVATSGDCDDAAAAVNPGAAEVCNSIDDDCDGDIDDDDVSLDTSTAGDWYEDADLDGYGDAAVSLTACDEPSGYVADDDDCDDGDSDINPGASEVCNGEDDDCDGTIDEDGSCPCTTDTYGGSTYQFCTTAETWSNASSACASSGYFLVTITSAAENIWVYDTAQATASGEWWMGLNDIAVERTFVWESGEALSYTRWGSGQPDNGSGTEDCVHWGYGGTYVWNDDQCYNTKKYVCESP